MSYAAIASLFFRCKISLKELSAVEVIGQEMVEGFVASEVRETIDALGSFAAHTEFMELIARLLRESERVALVSCLDRVLQSTDIPSDVRVATIADIADVFGVSY